MYILNTDYIFAHIVIMYIYQKNNALSEIVCIISRHKKITGPKQPKNQDNDSNQKFCNQTKITKLFLN